MKHSTSYTTTITRFFDWPPIYNWGWTLFDAPTDSSSNDLSDEDLGCALPDLRIATPDSVLDLHSAAVGAQPHHLQSVDCNKRQPDPDDVNLYPQETHRFGVYLPESRLDPLL